MALHQSAPVHYLNEDHHQMSVSTVAPIVAPIAPCLHPENIFVQAHPSNTGNVIIGKSNVAADGSAGGYVLPAGANMNLPVFKNSYYYVIASTGTQKLQVIYMRTPA